MERRRRLTSAHTPWLVATCVLVFAHVAFAAEPATKPTRVTHAQLDAALDRASREKPGLTFDELVQSVGSGFPLVTVNTETGTCIWNRLTLNRRGKQVDGFRFRVPEGEPRDMVWSFLCQDLRYEWYILPLTGRMEGFKRNWYYKPQQVLGDRTPTGAKDLVLQALPAASLTPGGEYILWIKFRHAKPRVTYIAINLLPAAEEPATIESPAHIVRAMGLSGAGEPISTIAIDVTPTTKPAKAQSMKRRHQPLPSSRPESQGGPNTQPLD